MSQALESLLILKEIALVILISVGNHHLLALIAVEAVIFILLNSLVLMKFLETVRSRLVVHHIDKIKKGLRH